MARKFVFKPVSSVSRKVPSISSVPVRVRAPVGGVIRVANLGLYGVGGIKSLYAGRKVSLVGRYM